MQRRARSEDAKPKARSTSAHRKLNIGISIRRAGSSAPEGLGMNIAAIATAIETIPSNAIRRPTIARSILVMIAFDICDRVYDLEE